jgi:hypothetical protein
MVEPAAPSDRPPSWLAESRATSTTSSVDLVLDHMAVDAVQRQDPAAGTSRLGLDHWSV